MVKVPDCFKSNPSYQSQAENDCDNCPLIQQCLNLDNPVGTDMTKENDDQGTTCTYAVMDVLRLAFSGGMTPHQVLLAIEKEPYLVFATDDVIRVTLSKQKAGGYLKLEKRNCVWS